MRWSFFLVIFIVFGCGHSPPQLPASARMFYFDAVLLNGAGKVFVYEPVADPLHPVEYWHKRFSGDHSDSHLYSRLFTSDGQLLQSITENVDQKGASLINLELSYPEEDSSRMLQVRINEATTFVFGTPDSTRVARYQIEYLEPGPDSVRVILTRDRRYTHARDYHYQGKDYPALHFEVKETLETETEGFTESTWISTEIYALGLGLVYYKKPVNADFVLEYRLRDIFEYEDFFQIE